MLKKRFVGLFLIIGLMGCKNNTLPSQDLTTIPVARNTEEGNHSATQKTTPQEMPSASASATAHTFKKAEQMQWYIIVASYRPSERHRAEKLATGLKNEGYPAQIIDAKGRLRVSIENYPSEQKAYERRQEFLKIQGFEGTWILKMQAKTE